MKNSSSLGFVLFSLLICGHHAFTSSDLVQDLKNGIEDDLIQISALALKYVSSEVHQNICAKFNPEIATSSNIEDESTTSSPNPPKKHPEVTLDLTTPTYLGCFKDNAGRMFEYLKLLWKNCSSRECIKHCRNKGYIYAGTQNGAECFCGNTLPKPETHPKVSDDECNMECYGNENEKCGGIWRMSVYESGNKVYYVDKNGNFNDENSIESTENYNKYTITVYVEEPEEDRLEKLESVYQIINLPDVHEKDEEEEASAESSSEPYDFWRKQFEAILEADSSED